MMFSNLVLTAAALVLPASAHFRLNYPFWRGDSLALAATNTSITQWNYPCAGVGQETSANNRTAWPLDGGSLIWASSHPWAYSYVNLGIGNVVTTFNVTLVDGFNQTGNGSFCYSRVPFNATALNLTIADGTNATIQVITIAHSGASLYNCADITFRRNATLLPSDQCRNATGVGGSRLQNVASNSSSSGSSNTSSGAASTTSRASAAGPGPQFAASVLVGGMAVAAAVAML